MYTVDYFIKKFQAIPEENIIAGRFKDDKGNHCANGWCGILDKLYVTDEGKALKEVLTPINITAKKNHTVFSVGEKIEDSYIFGIDYSIKAALINNGLTNEYQQPTPKQRILAALYDVKKMQSEKVRIVYVSVPTTIKEQAEELVMS